MIRNKKILRKYYLKTINVINFPGVADSMIFKQGVN